MKTKEEMIDKYFPSKKEDSYFKTMYQDTVKTMMDEWASQQSIIDKAEIQRLGGLIRVETKIDGADQRLARLEGEDSFSKAVLIELVKKDK